jgi:RNA polymerase primary sigma factor
MNENFESLEEGPVAAWLRKDLERSVSRDDDDGEESLWESIAGCDEMQSVAERLATAAHSDRSGRPEEPERDRVLKDSVGIYLTDVRRYTLLNHEEEIRLTRAAQGGDREARDHIVTRNLRLVISIAKRYQGLGLPLADLIEEGNIGLMRSVDRFDWRRGLRFSTYASKWIRQSITRALVNTSRTVRIPSNVLQLLKRMAEVQRWFFQKHGRRPTNHELCRRLKISMPRLAEVYGLTQGLLSFDVPIGAEAGRHRLHDLLPAEGTRSPAIAALESLESRHVEELLRQLSPREQRIVRLRFGFDEQDPKSLEETGALLGVTRERVRQLEGRALNRLRRLVAFRAGSETNDRRRGAAVLHEPQSGARGGLRRRSPHDEESASPPATGAGDPRAVARRRNKKVRKSGTRPILKKTSEGEGSTPCGSSALFPCISVSPSLSVESAA